MDDLIHTNATWWPGSLGRRRYRMKTTRQSSIVRKRFWFSKRKSTLYFIRWTVCKCRRGQTNNRSAFVSDACLCLVFCRTIRFFFFYFQKAAVKTKSLQKQNASGREQNAHIKRRGGGRLRDASIIHFVEHSTRQLLRRAHAQSGPPAVRLFSRPPPPPESFTVIVTYIVFSIYYYWPPRFVVPDIGWPE